MKIYIIYRGPFGEQMINNIALKGFGDNITNLYELKPETIEDEHNNQENIWEKIWEEPEKYIPKDLPIEKCDLLLVLGIHSKLGDLIPPIAERLGVKAYTDLDELVADPDIPAIGLFTGPVGRADLVRRIIRAGKDVMMTTRAAARRLKAWFRGTSSTTTRWPADTWPGSSSAGANSTGTRP